MMIFRSGVTFLTLSSWKESRRSIVYQSLDFVFSSWPKNFWKNPSIYKLTRFVWDGIHHIFLKKHNAKK